MRVSAIPIVTAAVLLAAPVPAALAGGGPVPESAFQVRLGMYLPTGGGDVWDENEDVFTLDISDFDGAILGFNYVRSMSDQVDFGIGLDLYEETALSEYRDFVDQSGFPIFHDTRLSIVPLTCDVRFVPGGRYRDRGHRAPIPRSAFYLGGGVGIDFWEYEEVGDFLDFSQGPPAVFPARFQDTGATLETHVLAGVELPISRRTGFIVEGRYSWAEDDLGGDFQGLGTLKLGGGSLYGGVSIRF